MDLLTAPLENLHSQVVAVVREASSNRAFARANETELAVQLGAVAELGRLAEALLVDVVGEVMRRSELPERDARMTSHLGCRDVTELVQKITRLSPQTAARVQRAARAVRPAVSDMTGEHLAAYVGAVSAGRGGR